MLSEKKFKKLKIVSLNLFISDENARKIVLAPIWNREEVRTDGFGYYLRGKEDIDMITADEVTEILQQIADSQILVKFGWGPMREDVARSGNYMRAELEDGAELYAEVPFFDLSGEAYIYDRFSYRWLREEIYQQACKKGLTVCDLSFEKNGFYE